MKMLVKVFFALLAISVIITGFGIRNVHAAATLNIYADPNAAIPEYRYVEKAGDKVSFSASGTWSPREGITCGPEGISETATSEFTLPGKPKYSLCLVFMSQQSTIYYYIGRGTTITFQEPGSFYLTINDAYDPNAKPSGYITVNLHSGDATGEEILGHSSWQNPVTTQSFKTFQTTVFSDKVEPVAAEKEKKERGMIKPNEASSAVEYEFFELGGLEGNNLTINLGFARTNDVQTRSYGINAYLNNLSFKDGDSFNNSNFSFFGRQTIKETDVSSVSIGLNLDYLLLDGGYSDDDGIGVGTMISGMNRFGNSQLSWGSMYQFAKLGDYIEHIINLGGMYGVPVGQLFAVTGDLYGTYKANATYDGEEVDIDEPFMLNVGLYGDFYISQAFMLNAGVKKVLFVEDYTSTEIVIGAKFRF